MRNRIEATLCPIRSVIEKTIKMHPIEKSGQTVLPPDHFQEPTPFVWLKPIFTETELDEQIHLHFS